MQLGFTEEATSSQEQPIIILARVIDALGIRQEGPHDRGEIDEGIPIRVVARQATRLVRENDPDTPERDGGHQFLKAGALTILA